MNILARKSAFLVTASTAALLSLGAPQASAQNFLQSLFQGNQYGRSQQQQQEQLAPEPVQPQVRRAPPVAPRVTGPQYYTYKTDELVLVDFSRIEIAPDAIAAPANLDHGTVGATQSADAPARRAMLAGDSLEEAVARVLDVQEETPRIEGASSKLEIDVARSSADLTVGTAKQSLAGALDHLSDFELRAEKAAADAIVAHYSAHPEMIWIADGRPAEKAQAALRILGDAAAHGLDPADYALAMPRAGDDAALARFEMALSARLLRYVRDAHGGRVDPNRISGYHDFELKKVDLKAALAKLAGTDDVSAFLRAQHPQNEFYRTLRVELEQLRASEENEVVIAPGTLIRPGQTNGELPRIVALIEKEADAAFLAEHGDAIARNRQSEFYSDELVPVIRAAQARRNLQVDGVIGPRTVTAFAGESRASRIAKVELALEQIRWLPSDFGDRYVFLNAASAMASYVEDRTEKLSMRTVVGSRGTQTNFFQDEISFVEFHPYWGVPRSIIVNKYLPKLYSDPSYFDRTGFEVSDQSGRRIPSAAIDWTRYGANIPYNVRQRPGPSNALGELKIMFPNKHAIYMHDTPDKHLFQRDNRSLSNGCVRLEDPRAMAAAVLGWDRAEVEGRLAGQHSRADLEAKVPVYVTYFTAWPQADGKMGYYTDTYERDLKTREALDRISNARAPSI